MTWLEAQQIAGKLLDGLRSQYNQREVRLILRACNRRYHAKKQEENVNKYTLFNEHMEIDIYGNDPKDAIMRRKRFPRPRIQEGERLYGTQMIANYVEQPDLIVKNVIGIEDTNSSTRGNKPYIRVIVETSDGTIHPIDMQQATVTIS